MTEAPRQHARHAVCITGQARSFGEIGHNIREGALLLHGTPRIAFFGVVPANDSWASIRRLLPLTRVATQRVCFDSPTLQRTKQWLHCDMRGTRTHDCRASFLQQLCDLQLCEQLVADDETRRGVLFHTVMRLRPDLFWEARVTMPQTLDTRAVYVPGSDSQGGVNDHMAFGSREPMRRYLTRMRHLTAGGHASIESLSLRLDHTPLRGRSGEGHLRLALRADGVPVRRLQPWALCLHTKRALASRSGFRGCIGRVRCRSPCASLVCADSGFKSGECECYNEPCAVLATGAPVAAVPFEPPAKTRRGTTVKVDRFRWLAVRRYGTFGPETIKLSPRTIRRQCIDVNSTQLFHPTPCASAGGVGDARAETCGGCAWPSGVEYESLEQLPACILGSRSRARPSSSPSAAPTNGVCRSITRRFVFAGTADFWPEARGFWPA